MTLDDISKLSDDELRVKVAELCGWGITENLGSSGGVLARQPNGQTLWDQAYLNKHQALVNEAPNFPGDLNAMAEARKTLNQSERDIYSKILHFTIPHSYIAPQYEGEIQWDEYYEIVDADARSHAIAFIATKEGVR